MIPSCPWPLGRLLLQSLTPKFHPALIIASSGLSELCGQYSSQQHISGLLGPSLSFWASRKYKRILYSLPQTGPARCALPQNLLPQAPWIKVHTDTGRCAWGRVEGVNEAGQQWSVDVQVCSSSVAFSVCRFELSPLHPGPQTLSDSRWLWL